METRGINNSTILQTGKSTLKCSRQSLDIILHALTALASTATVKIAAAKSSTLTGSRGIASAELYSTQAAGKRQHYQGAYKPLWSRVDDGWRRGKKKESEDQNIRLKKAKILTLHLLGKGIQKPLFWGWERNTAEMKNE